MISCTSTYALDDINRVFRLKSQDNMNLALSKFEINSSITSYISVHDTWINLLRKPFKIFLDYLIVFL